MEENRTERLKSLNDERQNIAGIENELTSR